MENRNKFGILHDTNKRIFTTWGERAFPDPGLQDDHTPFERRGMNWITNIGILAHPNILKWYYVNRVY